MANDALVVLHPKDYFLQQIVSIQSTLYSLAFTFKHRHERPGPFYKTGYTSKEHHLYAILYFHTLSKILQYKFTADFAFFKILLQSHLPSNNLVKPLEIVCINHRLSFFFSLQCVYEISSNLLILCDFRIFCLCKLWGIESIYTEKCIRYLSKYKNGQTDNNESDYTAPLILLSLPFEVWI